VLGEDVVEIAHRLVKVEPEDEADRIHRSQWKTSERDPASAAATAETASGNT
jgi:hypothetical protein